LIGESKTLNVFVPVSIFLYSMIFTMGISVKLNY
jgi:hypothetical protein